MVEHVLYICGPPCAGKSLLCRELMRRFDNAIYVSGDSFMEQKPETFSPDMVGIVNRCLLSVAETLLDEGKPRILLEWVPFRGSMVTRLGELCEGRARLSVVGLYASPTVLDARKRSRDGVPGAYDPAPLVQAMTESDLDLKFDTEIWTIHRIASILRWRLSL